MKIFYQNTRNKLKYVATSLGDAERRDDCWMVI